MLKNNKRKIMLKNNKRKIIKEEINYEKIFKPETLDLLKGKSRESLKNLSKSINLNTSRIDTIALLEKVIYFEEDHIPELEKIAVDIIHQAYPIIEYAGVKIDAKIVTDVDTDMPPISCENCKESWEEIPSEKKRRIINAITQGSSIRGAFAFLLFRDNLDKLDPELVNDYNGLIKRVFGVFDDENLIAFLLARLSQNTKEEGGKVYVKFHEAEGEGEEEYNEEETPTEITIVARAICFPMLVHEIVKGLYEILSLQGFGPDKEQNQNIVKNVDILSNEPHDMQYGKFIYDAVSNLYNESNYDDPRIRELLFVEIYKMDDEEFINFIENAINEKLTSQQKSWVNNTMKAIETDLKKDDSGLDGLDEVKRKKK